MAGQLLFSNFASTTLSGAITPTALSLAVAAGSGVEFPVPGANQYFTAVLSDAATNTIKEVLRVTGVSGDTLTITRAQQGTTAASWNAGDFLICGITAGDMAQFLQVGVDPPDNFAQASLTVAQNGNNSYALAWNLVQTTYAQGNPQGLVQFLSPNTSSTVSLTDGTKTQPLVKLNGQNLQPGDATGYIPIVNDGTNWRFLIPVASDYPQSVVGSPIIYFDVVNGADTNTGTSTTNAFKTLQAALNYGVARFVTQGKTLGFQAVSKGTYASPTSIPSAAGAITVTGATSTAGDTLLQGQGVTGASGVIQVQGSTVTFANLTISNTSTNINTITALSGGTVILSNVNCAKTQSAAVADVLCQGGQVQIVGPMMFNASGSAALYTQGGSIVVNSGVTLTLGANNSYSIGTVAAVNSGGSITFNSGSSFSGSGITGPRYTATVNASINTYGGGASFIPGSTSGSTASGGAYN